MNRQLTAGAMVAVVTFLSSCARAPEPPPYEPVGDDAHLMKFIVEPAAEKIWDSSGVIVTEDGEQDLAPTTEEGWLEVKHGAAVIAESGNLLLMPSRSQDREDWIQISKGLIEAGERAMAAANAQDADALFDSGAALYGVCVSCHQLYWAESGRFTKD